MKINNKSYKYIPALLSSSFNDIKLYKVIMITICHWVFNTYRYHIYNNNSPKKGEKGIEPYRSNLVIAHWN